MNRSKFEYFCKKEKYYEILLTILDDYLNSEVHYKSEEEAVEFFRKELKDISNKLDKQK